MIYLAYATIVSTILAVVLGVARGVPLLHLLLPPYNIVGDWAGVIVCGPIAALFVYGMAFEDEEPGWLILATAWALALAYFWWVAAWHLRERR